MTTDRINPWHVVRRSKLHGNGVFAARTIPAGTRIIEYGGTRISAAEADRRHPTNPDDPFHTFFFALSSGKVIDGGDEGNDARWINHCCEPNCEAQEGRHGKRVYIVALREIAAGEELFYDYGLVLDGKITKSLQEGYRCLCGTPSCRHTMLALSKKLVKKAQERHAEQIGKLAEKPAKRRTGKQVEPAQEASGGVDAQPAEKPAPKKAAPKKAAPKKTAPKQAEAEAVADAVADAVTETAPQQAAPKKAAKKAAPKKAAKKAVAQPDAAPARKAAAKKAAAKKAAPRKGAARQPADGDAQA